MVKVFLSFLIVASLYLVSCQKELSFGDGGSGSGNGGGNGGGGGTTGNTLVKTVSKNGTDSVVSIYTYNADKKLINYKMTGMMQGVDVGNEFRYYRNTSGIITHYVQINPNLVLAGIDSVTSITHYDAAASRYTSSVGEISLFGISVKDSTVLVYDAAGKVIRTDLYQEIPFIGGYELSLKTQYTYAANGNVTQLSMFSHEPATGTDDLISTIKYTFDTKTSSLINTVSMFATTNEAFVIGHGDWGSVNNATKIEITDIGDPSNNQASTVTYTYNSNNRPATGVNTRTPGGIVDNLVFYYQ